MGREDDPLSQFDVPRLRVTLSGGVFRPWMRYLFQFDFSRTGGEGASKIKDAIFEIRPTGRSYRIAAGQFKAPVGLQQLTSSGRLQFVDRAITDAKFNPGRDMGAMFSGTAAGRRIGYDIGVFNGSGESVRQNNRSHLRAGRVFVNPLAPYTLSEGASDAGVRPALHSASASEAGNRSRSDSAPISRHSRRGRARDCPRSAHGSSAAGVSPTRSFACSCRWRSERHRGTTFQRSDFQCCGSRKTPRR